MELLGGECDGRFKGATYDLFGLMLGVVTAIRMETYPQCTEAILVFTICKSLKGHRLLHVLLRPPDQAISYFRHVHVCRGAFFHVKLDYISDDIRTPIPGSLKRRSPQENLRVHVAKLSRAPCVA